MIYIKHVNDRIHQAARNLIAQTPSTKTIGHVRFNSHEWLLYYFSKKAAFSKLQKEAKGT